MDSQNKDSKRKILEEQPEFDVELVFDSDSTDDSSDDDANVIISDLEESKNDIVNNTQKPYVVLSEADIRQCQERDIMNISDILSISKVEATILLIHFNWAVTAVPDAWFSNGKSLREDLGLFDVRFDEAGSSYSNEMTCGRCWKPFPQQLVAGLSCGHIYCKTCWAGHIGTALEDSLPSLLLRCPELSCNAVIGQDMIDLLALEQDKEKYARNLLKSYIDCNPKANWCPAAGCKYAVILLNSLTTKVTCKCTHSFCWKCVKEAHQPISCSDISHWVMENIVQSGNWTVVNSRGCPNCGQQLKMDGPFKRVECTTCDLHFCKVCRGSWLKHGVWEGDQYKHICSKGKEKQTENDDNEEQKKVAQESLNKYNASFSKWMAYEVRLVAANEEVKKLDYEKLKEIADRQGIIIADTAFLPEAWLQITECNRILKWTVVYEYYLHNTDNEKRFIMNYLLSRAEVVLQQLYECESQVATLFNIEAPSAKFLQMRDRLCVLTSVARNYFDNMSWAMESKLSDLRTLRQTMSSRRMQLGIPTKAPGSSSAPKIYPDPTDYRNCAHCQFPNDIFDIICVMCYH